MVFDPQSTHSVKATPAAPNDPGSSPSPGSDTSSTPTGLNPPKLASSTDGSESPASTREVRADEPPSSLRRVASLIKSGKAHNIVLLLGAGISTSAGIPDFRSPHTGLYHNLQKLNLPFPEAVFELGFFRKRPEPFWTLAKELYPGKHFPTPTHYLLPLLHRHRLLKRVFTQNIDTLETLSGLPADLIVEAHGSFATSHCLQCGREIDRAHVLRAGVRRGEVVRCTGPDGCGGLVKPDIVFFGEGLPDRFFRLIPELKKCDLLIVIGTSLQVHPFASLVDYVPSDCPRLLINREAVGPFARLPNSRSTGLQTSLNKILKGSPGKGKVSKGKGKDRGEDKIPRDMYWEGDADDGVWRLVDELGWKEELEELMATGREELEAKYKEAERLEQGQISKTVGNEDEDKGADEDGATLRANKGAEAVKEVVGLGPNPDKDQGEELEEAIRRQLKL